MNKIGKLLTVFGIAAAAAVPAGASRADYFVPYQESDLRLPSVPLLVNDPYFSIWSNYDSLNGGQTRHWCEHEKPLQGLLRVDGVTYRFMGTGIDNLLRPVAPMAVDGTAWEGRVSYSAPATADWTSMSFDDSAWNIEKSAWGTRGEYPSVATPWTGDDCDIYIRREIDLTPGDLEKDLRIVFSHDDVFELYLNGMPMVSTGQNWKQGEQTTLTPEQKKALRPGKNILAAHCHNTTGGSYADFGLYENILPQTAPIKQARQNSVDVMATSSYYNFTCGPVDLDVVFTAPMLIDDPDLISTPVNYISYQVKSTDGRPHDVQFFLSATPLFTVNEASQPTVSQIWKEGKTEYIRSGSEEQKILGRSGDLISIDWGYLYIPAINGKVSVAPAMTAEADFAATGRLPKSIKGQVRSTGLWSMPALVFCNNLGKVSEARDFMMIGYDEVEDIQYMGKNYKAYYARDGKTVFDAFGEMERGYDSIMDRCRALDRQIYDDALAAGNKKYAELLAGNYRLVMAAHKLFRDDKGQMLYFSKENKSNGCVNTVDLTYPSSPLFLLYNPELQKGMILSILDYALSDARKGKNCSAHDLGQYPLANGQVYGDTMPLEESANIILLANAICRITGDASWLDPYRDVLKTWATYTVAEGGNPGNQLCTDDFKGPSEQNTNLSLKAILAARAYAELTDHMGGDPVEKAFFEKRAREMAAKWVEDAADGDHYRMEFHKPGTWSQKYNLIWDRMMDYGLFPAEVAGKELQFYRGKQMEFGLPLDCRDLQTKNDWIMWTAAMAPDKALFLEFADKVYDFADRTPSRIPLSDFYMVDSGRSCNFSARSVVGGFWMKVLMDRMTGKNK